MNPREAKRWKKRLDKEIRRDLKAKARAELVALREDISHAKRHRRESIREARQRCRMDRRSLRARIALLRFQARETLKTTIARERAEAKAACSTGVEAAKGLGDKVSRARAKLEAERTYRAEMRRIERSNKQRRKEVKRASSAQRRGESDDEVRGNLPPEYWNLWERVKRGIKGSDRKTRTEAFLQYAEENPAELLEGIEERTDALIREYETRQREARRGPRRATVRAIAAERIAAGDVPF